MRWPLRKTAAPEPEEVGAQDTLPRLLLRNARRHPGRVALREKEFGIWQSLTWEQYEERVRNLALGFVALGVKPGDKVAIIGDNRPEWVIAELAAQSMGAIPLGVYQDSTSREVGLMIDHSDARLVVAEDQEQVDKLLEIRDSFPRVERILFADPRGMRSYDDPLLLPVPAAEEMGRDLGAREPDLFLSLIRKVKGEDVALIAYTSGTTGNPKGAMLSHTNMLKMAGNLMQADPKFPGDQFVSFLPLPWMGEQMMAVASALLAGFTVNFPEEPETAQEDIGEIGPHVLFSPPRVWENLAATVRVRVMDSTPLKRRAFDLAMPVGMAMADCRFEKRRPSPLLRLAYLAAYLGVFRALRERMGFARLRSASTGGAALGPETFRFFHGLGVDLKQIYGQTEISGISCIHPQGDVDFSSVGKPIPETEIVISSDGEILSRSPSVFLGYYKDDQATTDTMKDGWLHSGDAGYFAPNGHLVVIDRIKDIMRLSDRTRFSPQFVENKLKFSPFIKEAVVVGDGRPYLTGLLCIDFGVVGKWAEKRRIGYTTYTDLAGKQEIYDLIEGEARAVNADLERIDSPPLRKFVLLYKELDADDEELTRTRKVRRGFINQRYHAVIEALYTEAPSVPVDTIIKFQDGRTARIRTTLAIRELARGAGTAAAGKKGKR